MFFYVSAFIFCVLFFFFCYVGGEEIGGGVRRRGFVGCGSHLDFRFYFPDFCFQELQAKANLEL